MEIRDLFLINKILIVYFFPLLGVTNFSWDCDLMIFNFVKWGLTNFYTVCVMT